MTEQDNFEIDTAQPVTTAVPVTDPKPTTLTDITAAGEDDGSQDEPVDNRPTWDIEYKLGDGGGVEEIHADSADEARAIFLGRYAEDKQPEILTVEPG